MIVSINGTEAYLNAKYRKPVLIMAVKKDGVIVGFNLVHSKSVSGILPKRKEWKLIDEKGELKLKYSAKGIPNLVYRTWKENFSEEDKQRFIDDLNAGIATKSEIDHYTRPIGDDVCRACILENLRRSDPSFLSFKRD